MRIWTVVMLVAVLLLSGNAARAHPEHLPETINVNVYVNQRRGQVELLVRTPLFLFTDIGLPLRGPGYVDIRAFQRVDPYAGDGATYAERAANAVAKVMTLYAGGRAIDLGTRSVQLAEHTNAAFADFGSAKDHVLSGLPNPGKNIDHRHGFVDVYFVTDLPKDTVQLDFEPSVGLALGERMSFHVDYGRRGVMVGALEINGDESRVSLLPPAK